MKFPQASRLLLTILTSAVVVLTNAPAYANHPQVSLVGSDFEIDTDANMTADHVGAIDWGNVAEAKKADAASGVGDDSFGQGAKEDTPDPSVVSGSIPPNKSDLKTFGLYLEEKGAKRFLHLFWHRVQDPSGTTNMDFEFNQGSTLSSNGITPVRIAGDMLVQYDLSQGGVNPRLFLSTWLTGTEVPPKTAASCEGSSKLPCWSKKVDLSAAGVATGSINISAIPASESDGLGTVSPRTFGEATIDFSAVASTGGGGCLSFGSAYLKSRSSDSFSSALKDFVAPISRGVSNCASLKIEKKDDAGTMLGGVQFQLFADNAPVGGSYNVPAATDGVTALYGCTTSTVDPIGVCTIGNVLPGNYWVVETAAPAGHDIAAPQAITVSVGDELKTYTFENARQPASVKIVKQDDAGAALNGAGFTLYNDLAPTGTFQAGTDTAVSPAKSCTTAVNGTCTISSILPPGKYCVDETTVPVGYTKAAAQCFTLALNQNLELSTFVNVRKTGAIRITKTRKHAAAAVPAADPHAGVEFTVSGGGLAQSIKATTDSQGIACVGGLSLSSFAGVGNYTVTETVPANYVADGDLAKTVTVSLEATCGSGNEAAVAFSNTPLTDISISVDSLINGGTKSTIVCKLGETVVGEVNPAQGDPTLNLEDLNPGLYVCTIDVDP